MNQDTRKNIDKKTKGKLPNMVPFSNEYVKKVLLGTAIIAGGVGLAGSPNPVYAASPDQVQVPAIVETVKKEALASPQTQGIEDKTQDQATESQAGETQISAGEEKSNLSPEGPINKQGIEALFNVDEIKAQAEENLELGEEKPAQAQGAGETVPAEAGATNLQKADEPNYSTDEKEIKDYSGSERYKETDLDRKSVV